MQFSSQREYTTQATHSSLSFELATAGNGWEGGRRFRRGGQFPGHVWAEQFGGKRQRQFPSGRLGCSCAHRCPGERILQRNHTEAGHGIGGGANHGPIDAVFTTAQVHRNLFTLVIRSA